MYIYKYINMCNNDNNNNNNNNNNNINNNDNSDVDDNKTKNFISPHKAVTIIKYK